MNLKVILHLMLMNVIGVIVLAGLTITGYYWVAVPLFVLLVTVGALVVRRSQASNVLAPEHSERVMRRAGCAIMSIGALFLCSSVLKFIAMGHELSAGQKAWGFLVLCFGVFLLVKGWRMRASPTNKQAQR